ncbi:hypothetical protein KB213_11750 [Neokomagataea sp. TBRC 2177]|uniref:Uncharacterized protein n=1 Tax=Neokomagataea anthophila TaxID=2826925 RepID=A0ABS5EA03_9PROT|nr:glyoxalase superfamily protein [Neokomagataea anthophila]MBR0560721.1 hypothetical protein [Neokomagataea anthophila]
MAIKRNDFELHLFEHHGDASPGSTTFIWTIEAHDLHAELIAKTITTVAPALSRCHGAINCKCTIHSGTELDFASDVNRKIVVGSPCSTAVFA